MNKTIIAVFLSMLIGAQSVMAMDIPEAKSADAEVYVARCSACHSLPHPKRLSWPAWQHMLHVMKQRMQERHVQMSREEWRQVTAYLKRHAR